MNNNLNILGTLAKAGLAGVCIALVALVAYDKYMDTELYQNHLRHNTEILQQLKGLVESNTAAMERNTTAIKKNTEISEDVERILLQINGK